MCTHVNIYTNIKYTYTLKNESFMKFSRISTLCFYTHFIRTKYHSYAKDLSSKVGEGKSHSPIYLATYNVWMSERTLSVFSEVHRARNLVCYCTIADDLAKISKVSRINRADRPDQQDIECKN